MALFTKPAKAAPGNMPPAQPHAKAAKSQSTDDVVKGISNEMNNISRRLRVLEERYTNLRKKTQLTDQNMLHVDKKIISEIKVTNKDIDEIRKDIKDVKEKMILIIKDLKSCAKKEDVKVIEKYVNMWEPVQFVTLNQLKDVVEKTVHRELQRHGVAEKAKKPDFSAAHSPIEKEDNIDPYVH